MNIQDAFRYKVWLLIPLAILSLVLISSCTGTRSAQDDVYTSYSPPPWAPAYGYRASTRYVFFPEIGVYYDLYQNNYIYPYGNTWVVVQSLPPAYSSYDLRRLRQQQLSHRRDPQRYNPRPHTPIRDNSEYTPRRGGTPTTRNPQNPPAANQRTVPANPPQQNTPGRGGGDPAVRNPQPTQQRPQETQPAPRQNTPRRGGGVPATRNPQNTRPETPEQQRVNPPQVKPQNPEIPQRKTRSARRGGGGS